MDLLEALLLGILQGVTEWLPVSSSGHLVIVQELMGLEPGEHLVFDLAVHVGTLMAVCAFFRKELAKLLSSLLRPGDASEDAKGMRTLARLLVLGTIPIAIAGFLLTDAIEDIFTLQLVGLALLVNAGILIIAERRGAGQTKKTAHTRDALSAGLMQAVAIVPGISRSGSTIAGGMFSGLEKEAAATFAFLLSVPALLGAAAYGFLTLDRYDADLVSLIVGAAAAFLTGFVSIGFLLKAVRSKKLWAFSAYCVVVGLAVVLYTL